MKLHHGDYKKKLSRTKADLILTSPPYNIGSQRKRQLGNRKMGIYDPKSFGGVRGYEDKLKLPQYHDSQAAFLDWCHAHLNDGGILVYNHKPHRQRGKARLVHPMEWIVECPGLVLMEEIIWDRGSTHNHCTGLMWPQTERLYVFRRVCDKYRLRSTRGDEFRSDVWRISMAKNEGHCAPMPMKLAEAVIKLWSKKGDVVMDPYAGSGTTLIAAEKLGRKGVGSEKLKKYFRLANKRLQNA